MSEPEFRAAGVLVDSLTIQWNLERRNDKNFFSSPSIGSLQIRYNLGGTREPYNIDVDHRNMANGQPHSVNITRHERTIFLKVYLLYAHRVDVILYYSLYPLLYLGAGFVLGASV